MSKLLRERWSRLAFTNPNRGILNEGYPKNVQSFHDKIMQVLIDEEKLGYDGTKLPDGESLSIEEDPKGFRIMFGQGAIATFDADGSINQISPQFKDEMQSYNLDEASIPTTLQEGWNYGGWDGSYGGSVREGSDVMELVGEQLAELGVEAPPEFWSRLNSYINDVERAAKG